MIKKFTLKSDLQYFNNCILLTCWDRSYFLLRKKYRKPLRKKSIMEAGKNTKLIYLNVMKSLCDICKRYNNNVIRKCIKLISKSLIN